MTLCVSFYLAFFILPRVFHFTSRFSFYLTFFLAFFLAFQIPTPRVGIQNTTENARKMLEKRKKNPKREHFACVLLVFCLCFACVLLVFCLCFACVLLVFCLCFACVLFTNFTKNANPTHSVIWALIPLKSL